MFIVSTLFENLDAKVGCMSSIKVAMLTYNTKPRGGAVHAAYLAEYLRKYGVDVHIFSLSETEKKKKYFMPLKVPLTVFQFERSQNPMQNIRRMIDAYVKNLPLDYDIYHSQDCIASNALVRLKSAGKLEGLLVQTIHHVDIYNEKWLQRLQERAIKGCDGRIVVSKFYQDFLRENYNATSTVIHNGVESKDFSHLRAKSNSRRIVMYVGGLDFRKGLEYLILSFEQVLRVVSDARLRVIARGGLREGLNKEFFRLLIQRLGLRKYIKMEDNIDTEVLRRYYLESDVVILSSRIEGWGLSLMEGMAAGKPVIASRVGGIPELVKDGFNGYLVDEGDINTLAKRIVYVLSHKSIARKIGLNGRKTAAKFRWDAAALKVLKFYNEILDRVTTAHA
jgi:glycogen(starch) synthase